MAKGGEVDQYMCFGVDVASDKKQHIVALAPKIDNAKILHHILVFQTEKSFPTTPEPCGAFGASEWKLITGWAPGGNNFELPKEAGFPAGPGTTHWVFQMHYNNGQGLADQEDQSGYEICETDQLRPNDAGMIAFGSVKFTIPANAPKYTWTCDYELDDRYKDVKIFGALGHEHKRGLAVSTVRLPGGSGAPELIAKTDPYNFEKQDVVPIEPQKAVKPGDVLRTSCTWKNTDPNEVTWGEGTGDEMCFNFFTYYPAIPEKSLTIPFVDIGIPLQTWVTPSVPVPLVGAKCHEGP
jgi:hypothetical protein